MAISVLVGEKLVLFGRYERDLYAGIVQYGIPKKKLGVPKSTIQHNSQMENFNWCKKVQQNACRASLMLRALQK